METKRNSTWFWILTSLIVALIIVFIAQNTESVNIEFLMINLTAPGFLVFLVVFFLGFLAGWGWENIRRARKRSNQHREQEAEPVHLRRDASHQGH
ncbi:MAG: hypothetical protein R6U64_10180 [Bacteroidales bacterium]